MKFWAYLWGIETLKLIEDYLLRIFSFEPTYEGLKLKKCLQEIETQGAFWAYLWGIETILHISIQICSPKVLSLPMRDWNTILLFELYFELFVLSLPMRDWNGTTKTDIAVATAKFWAYLWGIETAKRIMEEYEIATVLSLPMRDWNIMMEG